MSGQYSVLTIFQLSLKVSILTEPYSVMHPIIDHTSLLIAPLPSCPDIAEPCGRPASVLRADKGGQLCLFAQCAKIMTLVELRIFTHDERPEQALH